MKYLAAYLLSSLSGKAEPSKADIENILDSCGADADAQNTIAVLAALKGKNIGEILEEMVKKLASVPSGASKESTEETPEEKYENAAAAEKARKAKLVGFNDEIYHLGP